MSLRFTRLSQRIPEQHSGWQVTKSLSCNTTALDTDFQAQGYAAQMCHLPYLFVHSYQPALIIFVHPSYPLILAPASLGEYKGLNFYPHI